MLKKSLVNEIELLKIDEIESGIGELSLKIDEYNKVINELNSKKQKTERKMTQ